MNEMKLNRRNFLHLTGAAVLVCAAGALTGCGAKKKSKQQLLLGEWYAGIETPSWTFYDDGTCKIINDYALGTWSLSNDDTVLTVTDCYGESHTMTLVSVDDEQLTVGMQRSDGSVAELNLYRSYEASMEKGNYNY